MIIIEGMDGVGKSTVSSYLEQNGYNIHHLRYYEKNEEGFNKLFKEDDGKLVLDRGFITEVVYGPVLREYSRIDDEALKRLIAKYSSIGTKIIYLKALKEDLLKRREQDKEDYEMLLKYYDIINSRYDSYMDLMSEYFAITTINTSTNNIEQTQNKVKEFIRR